MILKFAIGEVPAEQAAAVQEEEKQHGSFLRLPIEQVYNVATQRTLKIIITTCCPCSSQCLQIPLPF